MGGGWNGPWRLDWKTHGFVRKGFIGIHLAGWGGGFVSRQPQMASKRAKDSWIMHDFSFCSVSSLTAQISTVFSGRLLFDA